MYCSAFQRMHNFSYGGDRSEIKYIIMLQMQDDFAISHQNAVTIIQSTVIRFLSMVLQKGLLFTIEIVVIEWLTHLLNVRIPERRIGNDFFISMRRD